MHLNSNRITMVNTLLVALLLFCAFSRVLVDPQSSGFTFTFETENGVKRAYSYGTPDFHGTYFYYTNDGTRHVVSFGGSERASGSFVALGASRAVGPPATARYPTAITPTPAPAPGPGPAPARPPAPLGPLPYPAPAASYGGSYGGYSQSGFIAGGGGGGGAGSQSIAPGLVASAVGGGLG